MANIIARNNHCFICQACGKISPDKYGLEQGDSKVMRSRGWDESCMLNCTEMSIDDLKVKYGIDVNQMESK